MLEVLHGALVLLGFFPSIKGSEVFSFAGLGIFLTRVKPVLPRLEFSDHKTPHLVDRFTTAGTTLLPAAGHLIDRRSGATLRFLFKTRRAFRSLPRCARLVSSACQYIWICHLLACSRPTALTLRNAGDTEFLVAC